MCNCNNKITTELRCVNCTRLLSLRHHPDKDPIVVAKQQQKKCSKCGEKVFTIESE